MDSVFLLIDIFILRIILLLMPKEDLIVKKIIKFFKLLKRRIDIYNAEAELKFILGEKILHSQTSSSGLNPLGTLDFSPLYFFSKRKIALQGN